jgi:hypothetical protein
VRILAEVVYNSGGIAYCKLHLDLLSQVESRYSLGSVLMSGGVLQNVLEETSLLNDTVDTRDHRVEADSLLVTGSRLELNMKFDSFVGVSIFLGT